MGKAGWAYVAHRGSTRRTTASFHPRDRTKGGIAGRATARRREAWNRTDRVLRGPGPAGTLHPTPQLRAAAPPFHHELQPQPSDLSDEWLRDDFLGADS